MVDNDDSQATDWAHEIAQRIGDGVRKRRTELGMSAQVLANKTTVIGHPVTRGTIARLETGSRGGKVEVTELLVLAEALAISPAALLWHDAPDARVRTLPNRHATAGQGFRMFTGEFDLIAPDDPENRDVLDSWSRLQSLRRLLTARSAEAALILDRSIDDDDRGQRLAVLAVEVKRAQDDAAAHGWQVDGINRG